MRKKLAKILRGGSVFLAVLSIAVSNGNYGVIYAQEMEYPPWESGEEEFDPSISQWWEEFYPEDPQWETEFEIYDDPETWEEDTDPNSLEYLWSFDESELEGADPKRADLLEENQGIEVTLEKNLSDQIWIGVYPLAQYPEFPTGCEVTSLTMVLNYEGFDVSIGEIADNYLEKGEPGSQSYREIFWGNPRSAESFGCFAPVIVNAANQYLEEQGSEKRAIDLTGTDLEDLYEELRYGYPVLVWGSMYIDTDIVETGSWEIDGETVTWPGNEHCMVLVGFDLEENTVRVCDPLRGIMVYDKDKFERHYIQLECQAVVIKEQEESISAIDPEE